MPSILISNQFLAARTGSELHVLTLARLFSRAGWDVTCFTLLYGHPLQADFERYGIHVVTLGSESLLSDHYDVLFAQHRIAAEHLWNIDRISFGKVIVSTLGFITSAEKPPVFYPKADGFVFVSEETRDHVCSNAALGDMPVMVFPNYAPSEYFEVSRKLPDRPRRVCVLSNHPPRELHDLAVLGPTRGIEVDLFGYETTSVEVTPELVSQYDVVVSIGRTAQPCLAAGIPFYCYDQFGGPGYITPENVARHAYNNFSGRSEQTKRSSEELLDDLMAGYAGATGGTKELRALAREEYDLNALFARLSSFIEGIPASPDNHHRPPASYETISADYVTCYEFLKVMDRFFGTGQIYYSNEEGNLSEDRSSIFRYRYNSVITIDLCTGLGASNRAMRFDPDLAPCVCRVLSGSCVAQNGFARIDDGDVFLSDDPQYLIASEEPLSFVAKQLDEKALQASAKTYDESPRDVTERSHRELSRALQRTWSALFSPWAPTKRAP